MSVGYHSLPHFDAKFSVGAEYPHTLQHSDIPDDSLFDFKLFPDSGNTIGTSESYFDSSFDGQSSHTALTGSLNDFLDFTDESIFEAASAGATLGVSDAPGIAS